MPEPTPRVVGVRFYNAGKIHYFDAAGIRLEPGEYVVVQSSRGPELARVVIAPDQVVVDEIDHDNLRPVLRPAGPGDLDRANQLTTRAREVLGEARALAAEMGFQGHLQKAEFTLDGRRLTLHFESQERIDYREFARRAAREFNCRIDMHSIGPRDRARLAGGYGICGRELCCANWLQSFPAISIRMAKDQDKPLNPEKISGLCGRLLCCLSYEDEGYKEMRRTLPKVGHRVSTPTGEGRVLSVNVLKRSITITADGVRLDIPDRELGTVVRWDPSSKAADPPPSITRAEGIRQGLIEEDEIDRGEVEAWPPERPGLGPAASPPAMPPTRGRQRPATEHESEGAEPARRSSRRRRRGGTQDEARRRSPAGGRAAPSPEGRSRPFRRDRDSAGEQQPPPAARPPRAERESPADEQPGAGEPRAPRRRGRRGGRRRRGGGPASGPSIE